jgi:predicted DNA-binding WGR domain protein
MRIFMQSMPGSPEPQRYFQLILQQDLLGGWSLIRETGQQGSRGTLRREQFLDLESAQAALVKARDQQIKKGFRVMFSQGAEEPGSGRAFHE